MADGGEILVSTELAARLRERYGVDVASMHSDDGIVLRLPDTTGEAPEADLAILDPDDVEREVTAEVGNSALFASRFRECAARALLLPRRDPRRRTPLWRSGAPRQRPTSMASMPSRPPLMRSTTRTGSRRAKRSPTRSTCRTSTMPETRGSRWMPRARSSRLARPFCTRRAWVRWP